LSEWGGSVYGEPVQVRTRPDGRPIRFVWRSRLYTVRAILEHWVINREWWREPADSGNSADQPGQPELVYWRVEASPGQGMIPEVCELCQDVATGAWTIRLNLRRRGRAAQVLDIPRRGPPYGLEGVRAQHRRPPAAVDPVEAIRPHRIPDTGHGGLGQR